MRRLLIACAAALPALAGAQEGGARDASRFFDSGWFELQDNYEVEGTVSSVDASKDRITISREDLPPASLSVAPDTRIELDGEDARLSQIRQGQEVRATFNLARDTPLAVEIEAESPDRGFDSPYYGPDYDAGWGWDGYDYYDDYQDYEYDDAYEPFGR